jgi:dTDP-4-amino-4,6-dideoxygalactose transaminase
MDVVRTKPFPTYNPIGKEEADAAHKVVRSGILSDFIATDGDNFLGGPCVREFEQRWADYHGVKHAVSFNSATSGLIAAMGTLEVLPGDEVLVIGYSMCISATAPLFYDAIPVFVDIDPDYYGMDPDQIEKQITPRTKVILPVDLFGQSVDMVRINAIARNHGLRVLNDAAHVPGCRYRDGFAGTFGDIGVFSLNQHKIIHCGEGGVAVTNDDELALRLQLIRNHAEAVVNDMDYGNLTNMLGTNSRMGEVEAAIATEQLKKLPVLLEARIALSEYLTKKLSRLDYLTPPKVRPSSSHVYYLYPLRYHAEATGITRSRFVQNLRDLGVPIHKFAEGYIRPLYCEPIFVHRQKFKNGFPYKLLPSEQQPLYESGICPVQERLFDHEMIITAYNYPPLTRSDMDDIFRAFERAGSMK